LLHYAFVHVELLTLGWCEKSNMVCQRLFSVNPRFGVIESGSHIQTWMFSIRRYHTLQKPQQNHSDPDRGLHILHLSPTYGHKPLVERPASLRAFEVCSLIRQSIAPVVEFA